MNCNLIICLLFLIWLTPNNMHGQMISLMTYNIRYDNPNDTPNSWTERKMDVADLIEYYDPDIFGIQEGLVNQVTYLDKQLNKHHALP